MMNSGLIDKDIWTCPKTKVQMNMDINKSFGRVKLFEIQKSHEISCTPSNFKDKDHTNSLRLANSFRLSFLVELLRTAPWESQLLTAPFLSPS